MSTSSNTTANTAATIVAANAANVVVYCAPHNHKKGLSAARFATVTVGSTLGACRKAAHGFTAADVQYGLRRGHLLATPTGSKLHAAWVAATAKGATGKHAAAFGKLATAAIVAQASATKHGAVGKLPVVVAAQKAGTHPS